MGKGYIALVDSTSLGVRVDEEWNILVKGIMVLHG